MAKDRASYNHAYYEANKEKVYAKTLAYKAANREKEAARYRAYYKALKEKAAQSAGQDAMPRPPKNIYRTLYGTYTVVIVRDGRHHYAGTHKTIDEAIAARDAKLKELEDQHDR